MKWIGAILIIVGCSGIGFAFAAAHSKELCTLRTLISILDYMTSELQFRLTPLPDLCRQAAKESFGCLRKFFSQLAQELDCQIRPDVNSCVRIALAQCSDLPKRSYECLERMGQSMGRFDLEGQLRALDSVRQLCRSHIDSLEENREQRLRTYKTLGICAGAALAILFV